MLRPGARAPVTGRHARVAVLGSAYREGVLPALLAALALVVVATALGLVQRAREGRRRRGSGDRIRPADVALETGAFGERATLLQFSTEWCTRCPATARALRSAADGADGVRHAEVDLTDRPDLASRYRVLQTPTTLVLDGAGVVRGRLAGATRPDQARAALADLIEPSVA